VQFDNLIQTVLIYALPVLFAITIHEAAHGYVARYLGDNTAYMMGRVTLNPLKHIDPVGTVIVPAVLFAMSAPFLFGWAKPVPVNFGNLRHPKRDMIWVAGAGPAANFAMALGWALLLYFATSGAFLFGYAKPVPVNFGALRHPKRDMVWVALAGPGVNIAMAVATGLLVHGVGQLNSNPFTLWIWYNLWNFIAANVMLAVFNMLPILPLDGGRVLTGLLPGRLAWRYAQLERYGMLVLLLLIFVIPAVFDQLGLHTDPLTAVLLPARNAVYQLVMTVTGWA